MKKELVLHAYAKVNLVLDVLRKRPDGYHDVRMVMQNVGLFDVLTFTVDEFAHESDSLSEKQPYRISISANRGDIPTDGRNLIYKAIALMFETYHINAAIHVSLEKHIPVEAGMAGGSTDCAAALHAVNRLFGLGLSEQTLMEIGVKLGADVPFCVMGRTALSEGIGEVLTPVSPLNDCYILVAKPAVSVSTAMVYGNLRLDNISKHPNVDGMIDALRKESQADVAFHMENILEHVTCKLHPEIEALKTAMKRNGANNAIMSGSGPTVFGIFESEEVAQKAADDITEKGLANEVYVTVPVSKGYACPCCGYYTFPKRPGESYHVCPVCFWEDDAIQQKDASYVGGANPVSLIEARDNYIKFGACTETMLARVRAPFVWEMEGIDI